MLEAILMITAFDNQMYRYFCPIFSLNHMSDFSLSPADFLL